MTMLLRPGFDWFFPYLVLQTAVTATQYLNAVGVARALQAEAKPCCAGLVGRECQQRGRVLRSAQLGPMAGNLMDEKIIEHLRHEHKLVIGERTAETIKTEVGSAYPLDRPAIMEVKGRDLLKGIPRTVSVRDEEIRQVLAGCVSSIVRAAA